MKKNQWMKFVRVRAAMCFSAVLWLSSAPHNMAAGCSDCGLGKKLTVSGIIPAISGLAAPKFGFGGSSGNPLTITIKEDVIYSVGMGTRDHGTGMAYISFSGCGCCGYKLQSRYVIPNFTGQGGEVPGGMAGEQAVDVDGDGFNETLNGPWVEGDYSFMLVSSSEPAQIEIRLIKDSPSDAAGGESDKEQSENPPVDGASSGMGVSSGISIPLGMASLEGESHTAGYLDMQGPVSTNLAKPSNLAYRGLASQGNSVTVTNDSHSNSAQGNEHIRRVETPQSVAEVIPLDGNGSIADATTFIVKLYAPSQFTGANANGEGIYTGVPFSSYKFEPVSTQVGVHQGGYKLTEITEPNGAGTAYTYVSDMSSTVWRETIGSITVEESTSQYDINKERISIRTVTDNGIKTERIVTTYKAFPWGEEMMSQYVNPDPTVPNVSHVTTWTYYTNVNDNGYGKVDTVTYPSGRWVKNIYNADGLLSEKYEPFKDTPATAQTGATGKKTVYTYQVPYPGGIANQIASEPSTVEIYVENTLVSKTHSIIETVTGSPELQKYTTRRYSDATTYTDSIRWKYIHGASSYLYGKIQKSQSPEGRVMTYIYTKGDWAEVAGFSANVVGLSTQTVMTGGTVSSPTGIASKTTRMTSVIDEHGRLQEERFEICTAAAQFDTSEAYLTLYDYDARNRLIKIEKKDAVTGGTSRIVRSVVYPSERTVESTDETGVKTISVTDIQGRSQSVTTEGRPAQQGFPAQPDRVVTFAYSGLTTTVTTSAGVLSHQQVTVRDGTGKVVSVTDSQGITTGYQHNVTARTNTRTAPGNVQVVTTKYLDGQTKSVTGNGTVANYLDYGVSAEGLNITTYMAVNNSMRYNTTQYDFADRKKSVTHPSPDGSGTVTITNTYDVNTGQLIKISSNAPDTSDSIFEYDELGTLVASCLDHKPNGGNMDGVLTRNGKDRISESSTDYHKVDGIWWRRTVRKTYLTDGSATPTVLGTTLSRLSASAGGKASETRTLRRNEADSADITTTSYTVIDRPNATVTSTTELPTSTKDQVSIAINGLIVSSKSSLSDNATTYGYDALGRQTTVTGVRGAISHTYYNALGQVDRRVDTLGNITRYSYYPPDHVSAGRLQQTTNPEHETIIHTYDTLGRVLLQYGNGTYAKGYGYDAYGAMNKLYTYKDGGANPDATTTWHFDAGTGALLAKEYDGGKKTQYEYHPNGRLHKRIWARLHNGSPITTTYSYNDMGDLTSTVYTDNTPSVTLTPDRAGRVATVIDGGGTSTFAYHPVLGVLDTVTAATGHIHGDSYIKYSYDTKGRTKNLEIFKATTQKQEWEYGYDSQGRLKTVSDWNNTGSQSTDSRVYTYGYLANTSVHNSLTSKFNSTVFATAAKEIDLLGRLSSITNKNGAASILTRHGYGHDRASRRTSAALHDGSKWKYLYNTRGELISAKKHRPNDDVLAGHQFEYDFDGMGNRTKARYSGDGNGVLNREVSYTADALNRYTNISTPPAIGVVGRAPAGTISINTVPVTAANRQGEHFFGEATETTNPNGKWKQITITDGTNNVTGHRWMAPDSFTPTYDDDGNLTNDGRWEYTWNAENRLIKMETTAAARTAGVPWTVIDCVYDYQGRRISRKQTDKDSGGTVTGMSENHYRYDGWNCIARTNTGWSEAIYYTWGTDLSGTMQGAGGVGGLLGVKQETATTTHRSSPCFDGNGNVVAYVDTGGNILTRYEYDPFGNLVRSDGAVNGEKELYLFSTKPIDVASGLYYYGYRYYDPAVGRWINRDPIEEEGGLNLYGFIANNGINGIDYLGNELYIKPNFDINGKPCNVCCKKCKKTGDKPIIADDGTKGFNIKAKVTSPTFESVWQKGYKPKKGESCCAVRFNWWTCYTKLLSCNRLGGSHYGRKLNIKITPIPGAPAWRGLRVTMYGYLWCSCEGGKWKCTNTNIPQIISGNALSYGLNAKNTEWIYHEQGVDGGKPK